jgi:hypothetical protein
MLLTVADVDMKLEKLEYKIDIGNNEQCSGATRGLVDSNGTLLVAAEVWLYGNIIRSAV